MRVADVGLSFRPHNEQGTSLGSRIWAFHNLGAGISPAKVPAAPCEPEQADARPLRVLPAPEMPQTRAGGGLCRAAAGSRPSLSAAHAGASPTEGRGISGIPIASSPGSRRPGRNRAGTAGEAAGNPNIALPFSARCDPPREPGWHWAP